MTDTIQEQIILLEEKLLNAFQNCSLGVIEEFLHNSALFVYPNGLLFTKVNILDNYRSGKSAMSAIAVSDRVIQLIDDTVVVAMILELQGTYKEQVINSKFRYIRVWKLCDDGWKVITVSGVGI